MNIGLKYVTLYEVSNHFVHLLPIYFKLCGHFSLAAGHFQLSCRGSPKNASVTAYTKSACFALPQSNFLAQWTYKFPKHLSRLLHIPIALKHLLLSQCGVPSFLLVFFDAMRFFWSLPIVSLTSICSAQLKPCYDINGDPVSQIPCDPSANVSACCPPGGVCMTNFYCHGWRVGDTHDRVGACTDRTGNDPACPLPLLRSITPSYPVHLSYLEIESALLTTPQHRTWRFELVWSHIQHYQLRRRYFLLRSGQRNLLSQSRGNQRDHLS